MTNNTNLLLLCKMKGGSHSYGLDTPTSDIDWRGVFVNTSVSTLVGLGKHEHQQNQTENVDEVYTEFRNALKLLRSANTQMVELLYNKNWENICPVWQKVIDNRKELVDSEKLFSCLRGYMSGELRLANGERTGKLGGKRKAAIDQYGFSPKNFVQLFRLAYAGCQYFQEGHFPVNLWHNDSTLATHLLRIKTEPQFFTKDELNKEAVEWEHRLVEAYEGRKHTTHFNEELANNLCLEVYSPLIVQAYENYKSHDKIKEIFNIK